jgi:membrane fusion protein, copper/silver efflux system
MSQNKESESKQSSSTVAEMDELEELLASIPELKLENEEPSDTPQIETKKSTPQTQKPKNYTIRLIIIALVVVLSGIGYWQRERLWELMPAGIKEYRTASSGQPGENKAKERKILYWVDPMHPAYKSDKPGTAPDCGMDLEPVYEEENSSAQTSASLPEGVFKISPEKQQLIGVQYGEVTYQPVIKTLRTVGRLAYDETKIVRVHTKTDGWIENVFADFTGKQVIKGEPLISVYSPDLFQTQQEFLLAIKGRSELGESSFKEAARSAESLYQSARQRLELWDITEEQINDIERRGSPIKAMTLFAPADGFVITRNAYPKQRIMPDTELYSIADLSTIWVMADIYEFEASEIKLGQTAIVSLSYLPGKTYRGKVTYIYPQVDNTTRTLKVRIEVANPNYELKPDMYANVELKVDYGRQLIVPQEAIMDSGAEQMVFLSLEGGYFEPRKIRLGNRVENMTIVLEGLKKGDRVVTSANFLIDSESKLKSATEGMGAGHSGHGEENHKDTKTQRED